ncbi:MAG: CO dehydrogenase/acetyl-CoA synthase complex subunit epsilon [Euryarchaeota archaeon]|nr:CO dehydrogenase/acetyl-CoA synthase complex subunit epsilon [Euryarchaeota archaeon]
MEDRVVPWQIGNIAYSTHAKVLYPPEMARVINRAKRPLIVVGSGLTEKLELNLFDYVIELSKTRNLPVVASGNTYKEFIARNFKPVAILGILELINLIKDQNWRGFDGKGQYDVLILLGIFPLLANQALFAAKHFASIITISIDQHYEPNATFSFSNSTVEEWKENLNELCANLKK